MSKVDFLVEDNYFTAISKKCRKCNKGLYLEHTSRKSDWHCWRQCSNCKHRVKGVFINKEDDKEWISQYAELYNC